MRKIILAFLMTIMTASLAAADTLYLRDGRTVRGTLLGFINGRFVFRATTDSTSSAARPNDNVRPRVPDAETRRDEPGEVLFFRPNQVERIEIEGRSLDDARFQIRTVDVALGPNWIDSGVDLRRGERVQIRASGTILAGRTRITPDGLARSTDPNAPLPRAAEGMLIGAVGNDPNAPILELGLSREFVADRDGRLYLTANRSSYTDTRGSFRVEIRTERDLRALSATRDEDNRRDDNDPFGRADNRNEPAPVRPRTTPSGQEQNTPARVNRTPQEKTISVPGNSRGIDTGIDLRAGDQVTITATGNITAGRRAGVVSADGGRPGLGAIVGTYPVPNAGVGALIGYIRLPNGQMSQPFAVGSQQTLNVPVDGRLFLAINDDNYNDNSGSFSVTIVY